MSAQPQLSAQASAFLAGSATQPREQEPSIEQLRLETREDARRFAGPCEPVAAIEEVDAGGVGARLYRPRGTARDVLVWLHGGAFNRGDLDSYEPLACAIANRTGCAVLSVDYRLVPEHLYPAATDDAWTATRWAAERFEQVAVGGDSAGGNLAAAVALRARDAQLALALQLLVYPMLDPRLDSHDVEEFVARYDALGPWRNYGPSARAGVKQIWEAYAPDLAQREQQDVAPMCAATLAGTAPALVLLAEHDLLRSEGEAYVRRLRADGVSAELHVYSGQVHSFYHLLGAMDDAHDAVDRTAAALRDAFGLADAPEPMPIGEQRP